MAQLTPSERRRLDPSVYGLPAQKKYPVTDKKHAALAKARATQQVKKGNLSADEKARIDAKADKVLRK